MQRRAFIRLVGGGTLAAATLPPLAACSSEAGESEEKRRASAAWNSESIRSASGVEAKGASGMGRLLGARGNPW